MAKGKQDTGKIKFTERNGIRVRVTGRYLGFPTLLLSLSSTYVVPFLTCHTSTAHICMYKYMRVCELHMYIGVFRNLYSIFV